MIDKKDCIQALVRLAELTDSNPAKYREELHEAYQQALNAVKPKSFQLKKLLAVLHELNADDIAKMDDIEQQLADIVKRNFEGLLVGFAADGDNTSLLSLELHLTEAPPTNDPLLVKLINDLHLFFRESLPKKVQRKMSAIDDKLAKLDDLDIVLDYIDSLKAQVATLRAAEQEPEPLMENEPVPMTPKLQALMEKIGLINPEDEPKKERLIPIPANETPMSHALRMGNYG